MTIFNTINRGGRIKDNSHVKFGGLEQNIDILKTINNIIILGCGTSYHAGLYGMYYFKNICNFNDLIEIIRNIDFCIFMNIQSN